MLDTDSKQINYRDTFVNLYFELMTIAEDKLLIESKCNNEIMRDLNNGPGVTAYSNFIRLKLLEVPVFNGRFEDWAAFKEIFESLIHDNNTLTNVQKFHYLKTSLSADAIKIINNL